MREDCSLTLGGELLNGRQHFVGAIGAELLGEHGRTVTGNVRGQREGDHGLDLQLARRNCLADGRDSVGLGLAHGHAEFFGDGGEFSALKGIDGGDGEGRCGVFE